MSSSSYGDSMFDQHPSLDPLLPPAEVESAGLSATWPAKSFPWETSHCYRPRRNQPATPRPPAGSPSPSDSTDSAAGTAE